MPSFLENKLRNLLSILVLQFSPEIKFRWLNLKTRIANSVDTDQTALLTEVYLSRMFAKGI